MGKGGSSVPVTDYRYSLHMGICHGKVDSINKIVIGDKTAWCGYESGRSNIVIALPDLFGGDLKGGGPVGVAEFYDGSLTQLASAELASRRGETPTTTPGGRGIASVFFRGSSVTDFTTDGLGLAIVQGLIFGRFSRIIMKVLLSRTSRNGF